MKKWFIGVMLLFFLGMAGCGVNDAKKAVNNITNIQRQEEQKKEQQKFEQQLREQQMKEQQLREQQRMEQERKRREEEIRKQNESPLAFSDIDLRELPRGAGTARYTIRAQFVVKNTSSSKFTLYKSDFIIQKEGMNTVKAHYSSGGISRNVEKPFYSNDSYELYPGDIVAVSLDFPIGTESTPDGWVISLEKAGHYYPVVRVTGVE